MKKIIIFVLIAAIIVTLLFTVISSMKKQPKPEPSPIPQMSPQPTQLSTPFPSATIKQTDALKILSVYPSKLDQISTAAEIIITFDQIIDNTTFKFISNPSLEIETEFVASSVIFTPKIAWPIDTKLTITILYAKGAEGAILAGPYQIEFRSPMPNI